MMLLAMAIAAACNQEPAPPANNTQPPDQAPPAQTQEQALTLKVDGLARGDDGLIRGALVLMGDARVRTVGLQMTVDGADVAEWTRDDAFLTSEGGQVLQAAGRAHAGVLDLAVATTKAAAIPADGATLARFTLRPTSGAFGVLLDVSGDGRGVIAEDGTRLAVAAEGGAL